jgi:AsmA protein
LNPFVRLTGAGNIDIASQRLDYRVDPRAVRSSEGQGGQHDLKGIGIPFLIKGPWAKLSYAPDLSGITNTAIDSIIKGEDPLEAIKNQTGLDQLFGKKPKPPQTPPGETPQAPPGATPPTAPQAPAQEPPAAAKPEPAPESTAEPERVPAEQPDQGVPPNPQQEGAQPQKNDPKQKVDPLEALKGLLGKP